MTRIPLLLMALALSFAGARASALVIALEPEELSQEAGAGSGAGLAAGTSVAPSTAVAPFVLRATTSKAEVALGERFTVELRVSPAPAGAIFSFPPEVVTDGAELRPVPPAAGSSASPPADPPGVHRYEAALFQLTDAKVPPVLVKYRMPDGSEGEAASEPLAIKITSRLAKDADPQKIADIRGPVSLTIGRAFWIAVGLLVLALLALAVWLIRRRRPAVEATAASPPPTDPAAEARSALAALLASGLLARGDHRGFYIALTALAKRYLERRFAAPVLEMTTAEMVAFLRDAPKAKALVTPMRDLANAADQIKFARGAGLQAEAERHTEAVREMIRATEEAFAPAPASAAQEKVA